eukprot:1700879-Prymnesium_polylepis.1
MPTRNLTAGDCSADRDVDEQRDTKRSMTRTATATNIEPTPTRFAPPRSANQPILPGSYRSPIACTCNAAVLQVGMGRTRFDPLPGLNYFDPLRPISTHHAFILVCVETDVGVGPPGRATIKEGPLGLLVSRPRITNYQQSPNEAPQSRVALEYRLPAGTIGGPHRPGRPRKQVVTTRPSFNVIGHSQAINSKLGER